MAGKARTNDAQQAGAVIFNIITGKYKGQVADLPVAIQALLAEVRILLDAGQYLTDGSAFRQSVQKTIQQVLEVGIKRATSIRATMGKNGIYQTGSKPGDPVVFRPTEEALSIAQAVKDWRKEQDAKAKAAAAQPVPKPEPANDAPIAKESPEPTTPAGPAIPRATSPTGMQPALTAAVPELAPLLEIAQQLGAVLVGDGGLLNAVDQESETAPGDKLSLAERRARRHATTLLRMVLEHAEGDEEVLDQLHDMLCQHLRGR